MGWEVDSEEIDSFGSGADVAKGVGDRPKPGTYHAQVEDVTEDSTHVELKCVVVSPGDQLGKKFPVRLQKVGKTPEKSAICKKIAIQTYIRLGIITEEEYDRRRANREGVSLDFSTEAPGRQFIVFVAPHKFKSEKTGEMVETVNCHVNRLDDPRSAKDCVFDQSLLLVADMAGTDFNPATLGGSSGGEPVGADASGGSKYATI